MPQRLAAATTLRRAISNRRLSTGWAKSFFLDRGVNDDALELAFLDGPDIHCGVDGGAEQFFQACFPQRGAKASDLGGATRGARIKVSEPTVTKVEPSMSSSSTVRLNCSSSVVMSETTAIESNSGMAPSKGVSRPEPALN